MVPGPGRIVPITVDISPAKSMPWAIRVLKKVFLAAVPRPTVPYYAQISLVLQKYLNDAIAGNQSPGKALKKAQGEIKEIIKTYEK